MTMQQFDESGKEVYQVTCQEWINIIYNQHVVICNRSTEEFETVTKQEATMFHYEQVFGALKKGIIVDSLIVAGHPRIKDELNRYNQRQLEKLAIPVVTEEVYSSLNEGDKITINNHYKVTVYKKELNKIICKIYRCKNKAVNILIGDRYNISIGW